MLYRENPCCITLFVAFFQLAAFSALKYMLMALPFSSFLTVFNKCPWVKTLGIHICMLVLLVHTRGFIQQLGTGQIDLFSLGGLLPHFRPCDITLEDSCFQIFKMVTSILGFHQSFDQN